MTPGVKSATRVFDILEFFRETQRPLRLSDIAEHFGFPTSSVSSLLKTMTAQGYLNFDTSRRSYFPTARLQQLVSWIPNFEESIVMQAMKSLQKTTGELIILGTVQDIYVEYVEVLRATQEIQAWSPPGTKRFLLSNGMGLLLLSRIAGSQEAQHNSRILNIYERGRSLGLFHEAELSKETMAKRIEAAGRQDYIFTRYGEYREEVISSALPNPNPGSCMISMLVPCPPNHRPLALGIAGPMDRVTQNKDAILEQLRKEVTKLAGEAF